MKHDRGLHKRQGGSGPSLEGRPTVSDRVETVRAFFTPRASGRSVVGWRAIPAPTVAQRALRVVRQNPVIGWAAATFRGEAGTSGGRFGRISFVAMVLAPAFAVAVYLALLASDQYVSELRFVVRGSVQTLPGADDYGRAAIAIKLNNNQESQFLATYIRSRAMVQAVGRSLDLEAIYGRPRLDFFARLRSNRTLDELEVYWQGMVRASVDAVSGIVTVQVRAFTPSDSVAVSKAIQAESERLLDDISERVRVETMAFAEQRVRSEAVRLASVRTTVEGFRASQKVLDPAAAAKSAVDAVAELRKERTKGAAELAAARRSLSADAPTLRHLVDRLATLDGAIGNLERQIVSQPDARTGAGASPEQRLQYEWLSVQRELAETRVKSAEGALDRARMDVERRQVFLMPFSGPMVPERSLYPQRLLALVQVFLAGLIPWGLIMLFLTSVREHKA